MITLVSLVLVVVSRVLSIVLLVVPSSPPRLPLCPMSSFANPNLFTELPRPDQLCSSAARRSVHLL